MIAYFWLIFCDFQGIIINPGLRIFTDDFGLNRNNMPMPRKVGSLNFDCSESGVEKLILLRKIHRVKKFQGKTTLNPIIQYRYVVM